jgi:hypothetical protein
MNTRKWIAPSIALLIVAAAKCGSDDTNSTPPNGTGTTITSAATGGFGGTSNAGTAGMSGSGMGGSAGSGGSGGSAGPGGSAGTGGAAGGVGGAAGNTGAGGAAGGVDAAAPEAGDAGNVTADTGLDTAADAARDVAATDAPSTCPMRPPTPGTACVGTVSCTYGTGFCRCRMAGGMQTWQCVGDVDAANTAECPPAAPMTGASCADAGAGLLCVYNNVQCFCTTLNGDTWLCQ